MESAQLKKALALMKKTGDRCLIFDVDNEDGLMLMTLGEYERMLDDGWRSLKDLSEGEMMDRVNRDVAAWRSCHEEEMDSLPDLNADWPGSKNNFEKWDDGGEYKDKAVFGGIADNVLDDWGGNFEEEIDEEMPDVFKDLENDAASNSESEKIDGLPAEDENTFLLEPV